jgi:hypothetical protein
MKLNYFFILLSFALFSCVGVEYDGETRFVTKGIIVDNQGNPIPNIQVSIVNSGPSSNSYDISYTSGIATTNANGEFICITPRATNTQETTIKINENGTNNLQRKSFERIQEIDYADYSINLPKIVLHPYSDVVTFAVSFVAVADSNLELKNYQIVQENQSNLIYNNPFLLIGQSTTIYSTYYNQFSVKKNENLILKYTVFNKASGVIENFENTISVTEFPFDVSINL